MKAIRALLQAASSSLLLLGSCSLGPLGRQELVIVLPSLPPSWACLPDLRMALTWRDSSGRLSSALVEPASRLEVEVERGRPQAILALPSTAGRGLKPAGAIFPRDGEGELALDWRGGYAASIALALERAGVDPWGFDLSGLADEAASRCSDPWLMPILEAARALAGNRFRIDLFKEPQRYPLSLPGPGPWAPESPLAPAPAAGKEGAAIVLLPEGLARFLGPEEELLVAVDAEGCALFARRGR